MQTSVVIRLGENGPSLARAKDRIDCIGGWIHRVFNSYSVTSEVRPEKVPGAMYVMEFVKSSLGTA